MALKLLFAAFLLIAAAVAMYVVFTMNSYRPGPYLFTLGGDESIVLNPDGTIHRPDNPDQVTRGKWVDNNIFIAYRDDMEYLEVFVVSDDETSAKFYTGSPELGSVLSRKNADAVIANNTNMLFGTISPYTPEEAA